MSPTSVPLLAFAGDSGITPILSLTTSALATTDRAVRILCADRDRASVIFEAVIDELVERYPGRLCTIALSGGPAGQGPIRTLTFRWTSAIFPWRRLGSLVALKHPKFAIGR